jgi:16S rRNA (guanine527-N7)-methyltransferase
LAELTLPFCKLGGRLIAQKKGDTTTELEASVKAIRVLGGGPVKIVPVDLPEFDDNRSLVLVEKIALTPPQFPRRSGMPAKRPIS